MIPVRAYFTLLTKYLRPLRWRAALLGVVLLAAITLQLINPQIVDGSSTRSPPVAT